MFSLETFGPNVRAVSRKFITIFTVVIIVPVATDAISFTVVTVFR
jgi:hypothetical protein